MTTNAQLPFKNFRLEALSVFIVALTCRIFFLLCIDEPILFYKYPYFAEKILAGQPIGERIVDLSPFYLYVNVFFGLFFGDHWIVLKWIQAIIGAFIAAGISLIGMRHFNRTTGLIAGLLFAAYGNWIVLETTLEPEVFVIFFNLAAVFFLIDNGDENGAASLRDVMLSGMFTGLSVITKPSFLLFLPVGAFWLLMYRFRHATLKFRLGNTAAFAVAAILVIAPITIRNYVCLRDWVLVTADAGKVFYHGNAMGATVLEWTGLPDEGFREEKTEEPDYAHVLFRETARQIAGKSLSPSESSKFWFRQTLSDILKNPVRYGGLLADKAVFFFNDYEMHFIASAYVEYRATRRYPFVRFSIIAALGLTGMLLCTQNWRRSFPLYGVILVYFFTGLMFIVQSRYRSPAVPYLSLFSGYTLWTFSVWWRQRNNRNLIICILMVCVFFAASTLPLRGPIASAERWQTATRLHYQMKARPLFQKGNYTQAVDHLNQCLSLAPDFVPAISMRGKSLAILGEFEKAEADFNRLISLRPNMADGYKNLGFLYLLQKEAEKAIPLLRRAEEIAPGDPKVRETLNRNTGR